MHQAAHHAVVTSGQRTIHAETLLALWRPYACVGYLGGLGCPSYYRRTAHIAQSVEHILGKDEVTGSIPVVCSEIRSNTHRQMKSTGATLAPVLFIAGRPVVAASMDLRCPGPRICGLRPRPRPMVRSLYSVVCGLLLCEPALCTLYSDSLLRPAQ